MATVTLSAWVAAHAADEQFPGIVAGAPLIYAPESTAGGGPPLTGASWTVLNVVGELVAIEQDSATVDVSVTGNIAHALIKGVPDAASASSYPVPLVNDDILDDIDECIDAYEVASSTGKKLYFGHYYVGQKTEVYAGAPSAPGISGGSFADARSSSFSVVPDLNLRSRITITTA
jgi:hypothetical protein